MEPRKSPSPKVDEAELSRRETFGDAVRSLRLARGARQLDLALLLHVDHSWVSRLEGGRHAPQREDVDRLAHALALSTEQYARLLEAYERDVLTRNEVAADLLLGTDESLRLVNEEAQEARRLRLAGRPQEAAALAARSARWVRLLARRAASDRAQTALLTELVRVLVEQCKSHLDYVLPAESWAVVAPQVDEQLRVAEYLQNPRLLQLADMSREGALYLAGRYDEAYVLSRRFLQEGALDQAWQTELLRAAAINAGYVGDEDGVRAIARVTDQLLGTAEHLGESEAAFLLEGLARGQAALGQPAAMSTIERAREAVELARAAPAFSELRAVQLIRTHIKACLRLGATLTVHDERLAAEGIRSAHGLGYHRHSREIAALLDQAAA